MAAVDVETTGKRAGYHEIIQIAVAPLDSYFEPLEGIKPFYTNVCPDYPEREDKRATAVHKLDLHDLMAHAPSQGRVADLLREWFESFDLPTDRRLVPLAHNWAFESSFLSAWLGTDEKEAIFHGHARDAMLYALSLNDKASMLGHKIPFNYLKLTGLCKQFKVINHNPHDALADALAEARIYRELLRFDLL